MGDPSDGATSGGACTCCPVHQGRHAVNTNQMVVRDYQAFLAQSLDHHLGRIRFADKEFASVPGPGQGSGHPSPGRPARRKRLTKWLSSWRNR